MAIDVGKILDQTRDAITVRRVFGDPIEQDGVTVIPAAAVRGDGGGGGGADPSRGEGGGGGYGLMARPVGAFVISNGEVEGRPATDPARLARGALIVTGPAVLTVRTAVKRGKARLKEKASR
ncbi:MAG TPA: sporulation protein [Actinomycetota bacterium]|nr:sporulation protein [Actinomycetota bacterium]